MSQTPKVHVIDDDPSVRRALGRLLKSAGYATEEYPSAEAFLQSSPTDPDACLVTDIRMPGMDGLQTLREIKKVRPEVQVIMLTGHGTIDTAVEGLKSGAFDYVQKPANFEELLGKLEAARARKAEHEERIRRAEARTLMRHSGDV